MLDLTGLSSYLFFDVSAYKKEMARYENELEN